MSGRGDDTRPARLTAADRAAFAALGVRIPPANDEGDETDGFAIWDVSWGSLCAFLDLASQWRWAIGFGAAVRLGLDWTSLDILLRRRGLDSEAFEDLIAMEAAALEEFAKGAR